MLSTLFFYCLVSLIFISNTAFNRFCGSHVYSRNCFRCFAGFGASVNVVPKNRRPNDSDNCPCGSGMLYGNCCEPFHSNKDYPPDPVKLVRSRFSAFYYKLIPYIMKTTHPSNSEYAAEEQTSKRKVWKKSLDSFATDYDFISLKFDDEEMDSKPSNEDEAYVSFTVAAKKTKFDQPTERIVERSQFLKDSGVWKYSDAEFKKGYRQLDSDTIAQTNTGKKSMVRTKKVGVPNED